MTVNEQFDDAMILRTLDLLRYDEGLRRRILRDFKLLAKEIRKEIADTKDIHRLYALNDLLARIKTVTKTVMDNMSQYTNEELRQIAVSENDAVENALSSVLKVSIARQPFSSDMVDSVMSRAIIEGAPSAEWWTALHSKSPRT